MQGEIEDCIIYEAYGGYLVRIVKDAPDDPGVLEYFRKEHEYVRRELRENGIM